MPPKAAAVIVPFVCPQAGLIFVRVAPTGVGSKIVNERMPMAAVESVTVTE